MTSQYKTNLLPDAIRRTLPQQFLITIDRTANTRTCNGRPAVLTIPIKGRRRECCKCGVLIGDGCFEHVGHVIYIPQAKGRRVVCPGCVSFHTINRTPADDARTREVLLEVLGDPTEVERVMASDEGQEAGEED